MLYKYSACRCIVFLCAYFFCIGLACKSVDEEYPFLLLVWDSLHLLAKSIVVNLLLLTHTLDVCVVT